MACSRHQHKVAGEEQHDHEPGDRRCLHELVEDWHRRLALIAIALAHAADHRTESAAQRFGGGEPKALSGIRFDALIRAKEPGQLLRPLVRSLQLVDGSVNVAKLATDLYWWNDKVRTDWCFDYHGAAYAKPTASEKESA